MHRSVGIEDSGCCAYATGSKAQCPAWDVALQGLPKFQASPRHLSRARCHRLFCLHRLPLAHTFPPRPPGHRKPLENYPAWYQFLSLALGLSIPSHPHPPGRASAQSCPPPHNAGDPWRLQVQAHLCSDMSPAGGYGAAGASSVAAYSAFPEGEVGGKLRALQVSRWSTEHPRCRAELRRPLQPSEW